MILAQLEDCVVARSTSTLLFVICLDKGVALMKILIVDDELVSRKKLQKIMESGIKSNKEMER